jgi:hypothetical protein
VRTNTPCDARLLTNSRTVGAFQAVTGRISVTEGMGPFLRPIMLRRVINLFMDARRFFRDPSAEREFLVQRGVDYVVVSRGLAIGHPSLVGAVNEQALESASFLEQVADTPEFTVYRVTDLAVAPKRLPQRFPCETTPLTW